MYDFETHAYKNLSRYIFLNGDTPWLALEVKSAIKRSSLNF
jgi:hypothetical protein